MMRLFTSQLSPVPNYTYHDFAPSSASAPFLMLVCQHGTDCLETFVRNLTSPTFENLSKLAILILCLTFNNYFTYLLVMHPWPSCNGCTGNAVIMILMIILLGKQRQQGARNLPEISAPRRHGRESNPRQREHPL